MQIAKRRGIRSLVEGYLNWTNRSSKAKPAAQAQRSKFMEPLEPRVLLTGVIGHESAMVDIGNGIYSLTEFTDDPPLLDQIALGFGNEGRTYTNTYGDGGDGDPTNAGNENRTIFVSNYQLGVRRFTGPSPSDPGDGLYGTADDFLQQNDGIRHDTDGLPDDQGQLEVIDVIAIAALQLTTTEIDGTIAVASVDDARLGIFASPNPGGDPNTRFNVEDPETWDVSGTPLEIDGLALGVFNLTEAAELTTGLVGANIGTLPADEVNVSATNSDLTQSGQGIFVFAEDESVTNLFTNNNPPTNSIGEGLVVFSTQEQQNPSAVFSAADQAILNEIYQWGLGLNFAEWGSGDLTDYDPVNQAGLDFQSRLDTNANPTAIIGEDIPGSIHGFKFEDVNGDGVYEEGVDQVWDGTGDLVPVTFDLLEAADGDGVFDDLVDSTTTDENGEFWFTDLPAGEYLLVERVDLLPGNIINTTDTEEMLTIGEGEEWVWRDGAANLPPDDPRVEVLFDPDLSGFNEGLMFGNRVLEPDIDLEKWVKLVREEGGEFEGLTPGFWKTHSRYGPAPEAGWPETGFDPDDSYAAVFDDVDLSAYGYDETLTLLQALNVGGGAEEGSIDALLRHSTAALLNAAHLNIEYNLDVDEVIEATKDAIESGDQTQIEGLKDQFDTWNNQGADLSDGGGSGGGGTFMIGPDDADDEPGLPAQIGDEVMYLYFVTNTGEVVLDLDPDDDGIDLVDDNGTPGDTSDDFTPDSVEVDDGMGNFFNVGDTNMNDLLDPGETWEFITGFETITEEGTVCNLAVVTGTPVDGGSPVMDEDPACYTAEEAPPPPDDEGQGLTPGFWKQEQHFEFWTGFDPSDSFDAIFGVVSSQGTLLDALNAGGGGENALARHAVAALLNAANTNIDYAFTVAEVISMVQDAYASGEFEDVKDLFEVQNELEGVEVEDL